jgi:hypothetical protein
MNEHLIYDKNVVLKGFANNESIWASANAITRYNSKKAGIPNEIDSLSNPFSKNEDLSLTVSQITDKNVVKTNTPKKNLPDASHLTLPPAKKDNALLYITLGVVGLFVIFKIVE